MALRCKLYYAVALSSNSKGESSLPLVIVNGVPGNPLAIRFVDSSGSFGNDADLDRYGNLIEPNQFAGASGNGAKTRQAIGAWFQVGSGAPNGAFAVDFIPETGAIAVAPSIDPATVRRPRIRLRYSGLASALGTLYVQRQNSIEV